MNQSGKERSARAAINHGVIEETTKLQANKNCTVTKNGVTAVAISPCQSMAASEKSATSTVERVSRHRYRRQRRVLSSLVAFSWALCAAGWLLCAASAPEVVLAAFFSFFSAVIATSSPVTAATSAVSCVMIWRMVLVTVFLAVLTKAARRSGGNS